MTQFCGSNLLFDLTGSHIHQLKTNTHSAIQPKLRMRRVLVSTFLDIFFMARAEDEETSTAVP